MNKEELDHIRSLFSGPMDYVSVSLAKRAVRKLLGEIDRLNDVPLPYVSPLKSSHECRMCRHWLEGDWSKADEAGKVEIERQMSVGRCDDCTRQAAWELQRS